MCVLPSNPCPCILDLSVRRRFAHDVGNDAPPVPEGKSTCKPSFRVARPVALLAQLLARNRVIHGMLGLHACSMSRKTPTHRTPSGQPKRAVAGGDRPRKKPGLHDMRSKIHRFAHLDCMSRCLHVRKPRTHVWFSVDHQVLHKAGHAGSMFQIRTRCRRSPSQAHTCDA